MHRFYFPIQNISCDKIIIRESARIHYLRDVLRLKINDGVVIFDGRGNDYSCLIEKILSKEVIFKIKGKRKLTPTPESPAIHHGESSLPKKFRLQLPALSLRNQRWTISLINLRNWAWIGLFR